MMETVTFIISFDNERNLEECTYYIRKLHVPGDIRVVVECVRGMDGEKDFQEMIHRAEGEYKICMDEHTYIINDYFLYEVIGIFRQNRGVGAVGILGGDSPEEMGRGRLLLWDEDGIKELSAQTEEGYGEIGGTTAGLDGGMCEVSDGLCGGTEETQAGLGECQGANPGKGWGKRAVKLEKVGFLSGMMIATRLDTVDCVALRERGYDLVLPYQSTSWCLYDCREKVWDRVWEDYMFCLLRAEFCHDQEYAKKARKLLVEGRLTYKEHMGNVEKHAFAKAVTGYFWEDFLLGKKPDGYLEPDGKLGLWGWESCSEEWELCLEKREKMHVVMAFNHPYVVYAAVMLQSLYENNPLCVVCVHVLQCGLSEMDRSLLQGQAEEFGNEVFFYDCRKEWLPEGSLVTQEWSVEAYFRLFMMDVLPEDVGRVLYLDVDVIVNRPLYELYFMDMKGYDIVACRDFSLVLKEGFEDKRRELFSEQSTGEDFVYFNSGVMLVDVGSLRGRVCGADYMEKVKELEGKLLAPDQDILNIMHMGRVGLVDEYRYDLFQGCLKGLRPEEVKQLVSIVHYAGPKPWQVADVNLHAHRIWWEYAGRVGFLKRGR